ncbi:MAG: alpha-D-glucose phosphate-specific phosphoglucomutase [Alphaproteobacteria bacterium]
MIKTVTTTPFKDQKPGTSGLRKKVTVFQQPHYLENYIQATFDAIDAKGKFYVIGGDGRFFGYEAIQTIIKIAAGNDVKKLLIGQNGLFSTPAVSNVIRKYKADGAIILSASHNPGGPTGDFGVKYNIAAGGPAPEEITDKIYNKSLDIQSYKIIEADDVSLNEIGAKFNVGDMEVEIINPVTDYVEMMQELFDFDAIKALFASGFTIKFDGMHAITGPYAVEIIENQLGAQKGSVINAVPLKDFGGGHPDPNLVWAKELVDIMYGDNPADMGAASDGDGDRNMILGQSFFVSPSDSLAALVANAQYVKGYKNNLYGVARSMPTSVIVDKVAEGVGISCYETPTGWKFFGTLLDAKKVSLCGEESFGTGSNHIREKDGLWAVLYWLNIVAIRKMSIADINKELWAKYGRAFYMRHDFEEVSTEAADNVMNGLEDSLSSIVGKTFNGLTVTFADNFSYTDPVDGSKAANQGYRIMFDNESRAIFRRSGTGTAGATLRLYMERMEYDTALQGQDNPEALKEVVKAAYELSNILALTGKSEPDVIT